jgi:hypothetical protein
MKKLHLLNIALGLSAISVAQIPIYDTGYAKINAVSAPFTSDGTLNFNHDGLPGYLVPRDSGQASIYCGSLWVGGIDAGSQLHIAAQTYHQNGTDFWPGPIMTTYSTHEDTVWNHVWIVLKSTVDSFREGKFGSNIPASIQNWPGNGNTSLGEMPVLAPYADSDHNGTYNPSGGDYPAIRGDEAVFTIFNDARNKHTESGGRVLGIEVHLMAYQFKSPDTAINEATFLHYDIFNRSDTSYHNIYFGSWLDMEVGNGASNYIGCDSANSYWYAFCGTNDNTNGTGNYAGEKGYHSLPPAQSLVYICDTMTHFVYYNNDFTVQGNPTTPSWYYYYLQNIWGDTTHTTYGGTGYKSSSTNTNYMFSGNPATNTGWTETSAHIAPTDVRGISSTGPYSLPSYSEKSIDMALVFSQAFPGSALGSVALSNVYINDVKNFYNSQNYGCDEVLAVPAAKSNMSLNHVLVYPDPATYKVTFQIIGDCRYITLLDIAGREIKTLPVLNNEVQVNVSGFSAGIYFYEISDNTNKIVDRGKFSVVK